MKNKNLYKIYNLWESVHSPVLTKKEAEKILEEEFEQLWVLEKFSDVSILEVKKDSFSYLIDGIHRKIFIKKIKIKDSNAQETGGEKKNSL